MYAASVRVCCIVCPVPGRVRNVHVPEQVLSVRGRLGQREAARSVSCPQVVTTCWSRAGSVSRGLVVLLLTPPPRPHSCMQALACCTSATAARTRGSFVMARFTGPERERGQTAAHTPESSCWARKKAPVRARWSGIAFAVVMGGVTLHWHCLCGHGRSARAGQRRALSGRIQCKSSPWCVGALQQACVHALLRLFPRALHD